MDGENSCWVAAAARKIKKIKIGDQKVGIAQLDETIARFAALSITNEEEIGRTLLKEVNIINYVPAIKVPEYQKAAMNENGIRRNDGD